MFKSSNVIQKETMAKKSIQVQLQHMTFSLSISDDDDPGGSFSLLSGGVIEGYEL